MERLVFHVDVNSAFLAWEAARRVAAGEPDMRLIPACISGDPTKRTSVVLAKSIPAKKLGIRTGEPISMALRKCPQLVIAPPDFALYERNSHAFMDICRRYTPTLEKYSIDECFLDMSGTGLLYPDPVAIAREIKDTIRDTLGFTVNVGIGPNKLLAKTAGDFEKPDKVHTLFYHEMAEKFWTLPVGELISVGHNTADKLQRARIRTVGELAVYPLPSLQALSGVKMGQQLHDYANGVDPSPVQAEAAEAKGYSVSTTLEDDVTSHEAAHRLLLCLADSVALRMRADGVQAGCIAVTVRYRDFKNRSHQCTLEAPTDVTAEIYETAQRLFNELWDGHTPLRLLGVALTDLSREENGQLSFFTDEKHERGRKLDKAMDAIRERYGVDMISRASQFQSDSSRVGRKYRAHMENKRDKDPEKP